MIWPETHKEENLESRQNESVLVKIKIRMLEKCLS